MSLDKNKLFSTQQQVLQQHILESTPKSYNSSQHITIPKSEGNGFFDMHYFDDLLLGRSDICYFQDKQLTNANVEKACSFHIMLSGEVRYHWQAQDKFYTMKSPEIWFLMGDFGLCSSHMAANCRIKNLLLHFSPEFLQKLVPDTPQNSSLIRLLHSDKTDAIRLSDLSIKTRQFAEQLYRYPAKEPVEFLAIHGACLSFVNQLLTENLNNIKSNDKPTSAMLVRDFLDEYYDKNLTIRQLAHKFCTNECDLKRQFKHLTGLTINRYRRNRRLQIALSLLEQGIPIAKVASQVGYNSTDYFVRVFSKHMGVNPKNIP
ncbi:MAG: hypothetical protein CR975_04985 [Gammaproteobacteria bacterium]|nr:MAG: hypothetical protein CR975_04985 [Gammaproteobacteria bacterium]